MKLWAQGRGHGDQGHRVRKSRRLRRMDVTLVRLIIITLVSLTNKTFAGSCSSANLCCQGRDSGCVIQKESPNAIIQTPRDKPCYCDHACLKLADCCDDFKETCGVVDCAVSEWGPWSLCDNGCGSGAQRRSRVIVIAEKNGGKHCPRLDQVRTCRSFHTCHTAGIRPQSHVKSVILLALSPAGSNSTDVRIKDTIIDNKSSSCIAFTIVRASRACSGISDLFVEGSRICLKHHGNESFDRYVGIGRWKLASNTVAIDRYGQSTSTCHGKWIGDPQLLVNCHDTKCEQSNRMPYVSQLLRSRDRRGASNTISSDVNASWMKDRVISKRKRRGGRRWKRSRRR